MQLLQHKRTEEGHMHRQAGRAEKTNSRQDGFVLWCHRLFFFFVSVFFLFCGSLMWVSTKFEYIGNETVDGLKTRRRRCALSCTAGSLALSWSYCTWFSWLFRGPTAPEVHRRFLVLLHQRFTQMFTLGLWSCCTRGEITELLTSAAQFPLWQVLRSTCYLLTSPTSPLHPRNGGSCWNAVMEPVFALLTAAQPADRSCFLPPGRRDMERKHEVVSQLLWLLPSQRSDAR